MLAVKVEAMLAVRVEAMLSVERVEPMLSVETHPRAALRGLGAPQQRRGGGGQWLGRGKLTPSPTPGARRAREP